MAYQALIDPSYSIGAEFFAGLAMVLAFKPLIDRVLAVLIPKLLPLKPVLM